MSRFDFGLANTTRNKHASFRKRKVAANASVSSPVSPAIPTSHPIPEEASETMALPTQTSKKKVPPPVFPVPPLPALPPIPPITSTLSARSAAITGTTLASTNVTGIRRRMTGTGTNTTTSTINNTGTGTGAGTGMRVANVMSTVNTALSTAAPTQPPERLLSTHPFSVTRGGAYCAGVDENAPSTPFFTPAVRTRPLLNHASTRTHTGVGVSTLRLQEDTRLRPQVHNTTDHAAPGFTHTPTPNRPPLLSTQTSAFPKPRCLSPPPSSSQAPSHVIATHGKPTNKTLKMRQVRTSLPPPKHHFPRSKAPQISTHQSSTPPRIDLDYDQQRLSSSATVPKHRVKLLAPLPSLQSSSTPTLCGNKQRRESLVVPMGKRTQPPPQQGNIPVKTSITRKPTRQSQSQIELQSHRPCAGSVLEGQAVQREAPRPPRPPKARDTGWFTRIPLATGTVADANTSAMTPTAHTSVSTAIATGTTGTRNTAGAAFTTAATVTAYRATMSAYLAVTSGKLIGNLQGGRYIFPRFRGLRHRHRYGLASQRQVANLRLHARIPQRDQCACGALREQDKDEGIVEEDSVQEGYEGIGSVCGKISGDERQLDREKRHNDEGVSGIVDSTVRGDVGPEESGHVHAYVPKPAGREDPIGRGSTRAGTVAPKSWEREEMKKVVKKEDEEEKEKRKKGDYVVIDIGDIYLEDNHSNSAIICGRGGDDSAEPTLAAHVGAGMSVGVECVFDGEGRIPDALSDDNDTEPRTFSADRLEAVKLQLMQRQRQRRREGMVETGGGNGKNERHVPRIPENGSMSPYSHSSSPREPYSPSVSSRTAAHLFLPPSPMSANKLKKNSAEDLLEAEHAITSPHHSTLTAAYRSDWRCSRCVQQRPVQSAGWRMMVSLQGALQTSGGWCHGTDIPRVDASATQRGAAIQLGQHSVAPINRQSGYNDEDVEDEITKKHVHEKSNFFSIFRAELREIYAPQLFIVRVTLVLWVLSVCLPLLTLLTRASGALLQDDDSYAVVVGKFVLRSHTGK